MDFKTDTTKKIYEAYFKRVNNIVKGLPKASRDDITMELQSHVYEALMVSANADEASALLDIIDKLGAPEEYLKNVVAMEKLKQATSTFKPVQIISAIASNIGNGVLNTSRAVVFGLLYLLVFVFSLLSIVKLIIPEHTGLFTSKSGLYSFGVIYSTDAVQEHLGYFFIPFCLLIATVLYLIITLLLKLTIRRR